MTITFTHERRISVPEFIDLLQRSTLGERRPVNDAASIALMLRHANVLCTAWAGDTLVGVARSLTDFSFCCYLSDLAVALPHQKQGIGTELIRRTQAQLGPRCKIILLAAPLAEAYYPKVGFRPHRSAWIADARPLPG